MSSKRLSLHLFQAGTVLKASLMKVSRDAGWSSGSSPGP